MTEQIPIENQNLRRRIINPKRRKRKTGRHIVVGIIAILVLVLAILAVFGIKNSFSPGGKLTSLLSKSEFSEAQKLIAANTDDKGIKEALDKYCNKYIAYCISKGYKTEEWDKKYAQLSTLSESIKPKLIEGMEKQSAMFGIGKLKEDVTKTNIERIGAFDFLNAERQFAVDEISAIKTSKGAYPKALEFLNVKDYKNAMLELGKVVEKDQENYNVAKEKIEFCKTEYMSAEILAAKGLYDGASYTAAYDKISEIDKLFPGNAEVEGLLGEYKAAVNKFDLIEFPTSDIYHIFSHCLIAFPELSIKKPGGGTYDIDCIDPLEFTRVIEQMYKKNYVLIDINLLYDIEKDGDTEKAKLKSSIKVPKGKIPFVLSFDDVTYDPKKIGHGMVDKLLIKDGRIQSYTKMADGTEIYSIENEFVPILDDFVAAHPDFSFNGAKATLNLTGFAGILGYRTQGDSPNRQAEIDAVKPIVQMLKDTGYNFASHGYGHRRMETTSAEIWENDTAKWRDEVGSLVGDTNIYVYPYGSWTKYDTPQHQSLLKHGFKVFGGVGTKKFMYNGMPPAKRDVGNIFMDRRPIDGFSLRERYTTYADMMDTYTVYDHENRDVKFPKP